MSGSTHTVYVGAALVGPDSDVDVFGAHVGLTLHDLHRLRYVREVMERTYGRSVTLTDALRHVILVAYGQAEDYAVNGAIMGPLDPRD